MNLSAKNINHARYAGDLKLGWRHFWIASVTGLGQLVGTAVATIAGIIIPLLNIIARPELSGMMQGLIGAADLMGIMVGSVVFGKLSDRFGYLRFFRLSPIIITVGAITGALIPNVWVLIGMLYLIGFGIGGEYALDSNYDSVLMPDKWREPMLGFTKTGAAFGNISGAAAALWLVGGFSNAAQWPRLMWIIAAIGMLMFLTRIYFFESPKWLYSHGEATKGQRALQSFLGSGVVLKPSVIESLECQSSSKEVKRLSILEFIKRYKGKVILSGIPWACEGLGVYGIGVFIPILVLALGIEQSGVDETALQHVLSSVKTTLWISCIILPGFVIGIWLAYKKISLVRLQSGGFWICAISLVLLLLSYKFGWPKWISLVGFMSFELFLNIGPHLVTYLFPPKIYPVEVRGQGTGIAAAIGKSGAVIGVFLIPMLLKAGGGVLVLGVSAAVMAIGAIITKIYGKAINP